MKLTYLPIDRITLLRKGISIISYSKLNKKERKENIHNGKDVDFKAVA